MVVADTLKDGTTDVLADEVDGIVLVPVVIEYDGSETTAGDCGDEMASEVDDEILLAKKPEVEGAMGNTTE